MKYTSMCIMVLFLCSCSAKQYNQAFWFSEDGRYMYRNSVINTATYESFMPLQQYHGKVVKSVKQDGMTIVFDVQNATDLSIKVNKFKKPTINDEKLKSQKAKKKNAMSSTKNVENNQPVILKKKSWFGKAPKEKKVKPVYDWTQYNNKTIDWIVVLEHSIFIKFTDNTKCFIGLSDGAPCINNVKYRFTKCCM